MIPPTPRTRERPVAVRVFEQALADWLSAFTMPQALAGEMADACSEGAPWAAAIAGVAARRAGWPDTSAIAWGLCVGGLAGALEAARRSLAEEAGPATAEIESAALDRAESAALDRAKSATAGNGAAGGPALPLLAADGLVAAAHESLGSLEPEHAQAALDALARAFADGGPWRTLPEEAPGAPRRPPPAWAALVPCALELAADAEPEGPWAAWAGAWAEWYEAPGAVDPRELWDHARGDADTKALLRAAARAARAASVSAPEEE